MLLRSLASRTLWTLGLANMASNGRDPSPSLSGSEEVAAPTATFPKLVAFDLDYTLWPLWVDTHVTGPLKRPSPKTINLVKDRWGASLSFYDDVPSILFQLRRERCLVAACSRTSAPEVARQALDGLLIKDGDDGAIPARKLFDDLQIYPGSKIKHFEAIHRKTGIPYSQMLFFDDEHRNAEVERKLGVKFVLVPDGLDRQVFERGLADWRRARERG